MGIIMIDKIKPIKEAVKEFFTAVENTNWKKAHELTTKSWQENHKFNDTMSTLFGKQLKFVGIAGIEHISDVVADVKIKVIAYKEGLSFLNARLICETGPYQASPDGIWGVNPISCLRKAD